MLTAAKVVLGEHGGHRFTAVLLRPFCTFRLMTAREIHARVARSIIPGIYFLVDDRKLLFM